MAIIDVKNPYTCIQPDQFKFQKYVYPQVINAQIHPIVKFFMTLSPERIIKRYCHLHPYVDPTDLKNILSYQCKHFTLAGSDLMYVTNESGKRTMLVIENNSCPSGQKSMPKVFENSDFWWYGKFIEEVVLPRINKSYTKKDWVLAVIFDKNEIENAGHASALATLADEEVHLVYCSAKTHKDVMRIKDEWIEINIPWKWRQRVRWWIRYVTQQPRKYIPIRCNTLLINPIISCLAWGRNKLVATKAYEKYNARIQHLWLKIMYPETVCDVSLEKIPYRVDRWGGKAVVKNPYSNAWQWVYTITNEKELKAFMEENHTYSKFIVQSLLWNAHRSSFWRTWRWYHVGTLPDKKWNTYVVDVRMRIINGINGFAPLSLNARRAKAPLPEDIYNTESSRDILGTNLSYIEDGVSKTDSSRLILMDRIDFNQLWIWIDDLIEGYIQSVLSTIAIDKMSKSLLTKEWTFKSKTFSNLNNDPDLLKEIL